MAKRLSESEKHYLLSLPSGKDIEVSLITRLFTKTSKRSIDKNGKVVMVDANPRFNLSDVVFLKKDEYINKTDIETTVGKVLFNKICIEGSIDYIIPNGFINETFTKKVHGFITEQCSFALNEEKLKIEDLVKHTEAFEFYGLKLCSAFSPSFTSEIIQPNNKVMKEKNEMLKGKKINELSLDEAVKIEDSLVKIASKELKGNEGMTLYDSGSRGSLENDYKNISIMIGPVQNTATNKYDIVTSNFVDGIKKEDLYKIGNSVVAAALPKAAGTAVGGYMTKQFYSVFQSMVLDELGTDCGSKFTITALLDDKRIGWYMYQNMVINGKLVLLTPENMNSYKNKTVEFRTPMGCRTPKFCRACAGDRFRRYDITNVGLTTGKVSNELMQKQMKKFHVMKESFHKIDVNKLLIK